ncbi:hypothetical protein FB645_002791 [Coemansia sp. IMI 203386]|nr:hypothetical protein FB645_002791 [Coemansia sp. IMI 203386]
MVEQVLGDIDTCKKEVSGFDDHNGSSICILGKDNLGKGTCYWDQGYGLYTEKDSRYYLHGFMGANSLSDRGSGQAACRPTRLSGAASFPCSVNRPQAVPSSLMALLRPALRQRNNVNKNMVCVVCQLSLFNPALSSVKKLRKAKGKGSGKGKEKEAEPKKESTTGTSGVSADKNQLSALQCGHVFHTQCINTWIQTSALPTCPLCTKAVNCSPVKLYLRVEDEDIAHAQPDKQTNVNSVDELVRRIGKLGIAQADDSCDENTNALTLISQEMEKLCDMALAQKKELERLSAQSAKNKKKKSHLYSRLALTNNEIKTLMQQVSEKNRLVRSLENEVSQMVSLTLSD